MAIAFSLFVIGSPSEARAQSQEKIEKTNSISNWLLVGALAITAVAIIITVSKGDKKDKESDGEKREGEAQELRQYSEGHMPFETALLNSRSFVSSEYEAEEAKWRQDNGSAPSVQNALERQHGCLRVADEME
jgi:hypothetical protein